MPPEKSNPARFRRLLAEKRVLGTFVKLAGFEVIEIVASSGFDFALVDLEHSQLSEGQALHLVQHAFALDFPVVVRVPSLDEALVNRLLEAGATGIQLSSVGSVEEVHALISATRYAPAGRRSVSLSHPVAGYGAVPLHEAIASPHPILVAQIETAKTEDPLEEIFGAGPDVAFIGVTDLLVDLDLDESMVAARVAEISKAAEAAGLALGAFATDVGSVPEGARYVALSSDVSLLRSALASAAKELSDGS